MKISIIGAGSFGTALSIVASENKHNVKLYGRDEKQIQSINEKRRNNKYLKDLVLNDNIEGTSNIEYALIDADIVLFSVSSQSLRKVLEKAYKYIPKKATIINVAKGIENNTLLRLSEVIKEFVDNDIVILSGPSHAEEVGKRLPTTLVSASEKIETAQLVQDIFSTEFLRIYTNTDVAGVELGGALKNIIALAAGITDGMGFGDNAKAALMTRGIKEITRLGKILGANPETFAGLSGIGDLIVTCTSMHSRNRRCGILIGEGFDREKAEESIGMVVEGIYATNAAYNLSQKYNVEMPIVNELYHVLYQGLDVKEALKNLMFRKKKHEMEEPINF